MTEPSSKNGHGRPAFEWIVGSIAAVVVCALLSFLGYEALFGDARPPDLVTSIERLEEVEGGTLVVVAVANRGDQAAAEVGVEATVQGSGPEAIRKEIRFDYVASHAVRRGAFVVEGTEVGATDVELRVHGYVEP